MQLLAQTSNAKTFNSGDIIEGRSYPFIGGYRVEISKLADGSGVAALDYPEFDDIRYFQLSPKQVSAVERIEYDPYNDAGYAAKLLEFSERFEK